MAFPILENDNEMSTKLQWLEGTPDHNFGTTFGCPWSRGKYFPGTTNFHCSGSSGVDIPLQSSIKAYWHDGSIKWTAHAIPAFSTIENAYTVRADVTDGRSQQDFTSTKTAPFITVGGGSTHGVIEVKTGKINVCFSTHGSEIIQSITTSTGNVTGKNGRLVLLSQSSSPPDNFSDPSTKLDEFEGTIEEAIIELSGPVKVIICIKGQHYMVKPNGDNSHKPWLPFTLRFYLYANSDSIRLIHTIVYDGDMNNDFVRGIGIRFDIPLKYDAPFDRHVRISSADGGVLSEAVQGITGLRRGIGMNAEELQFSGRPTPPVVDWDTSVSSRLKWVPSWNDFALSQLSVDGFGLRKRTKAGCSWVKIPCGTRAGGLVYLGGATKGGLAVSLRHFWERYPTGLDIRNAVLDTGEVTVWIYDPSAPPMDMRQYHDGLGQETYDDQLEALNITYEDWEPETGTPFGIARTNELYLFSFEQTPDQRTIAGLSNYTQNPPLLVPNSETIRQTEAFGTCWSPKSKLRSPSPRTKTLERNLDFLFQFHHSQISQRRWYGFWDHGDIMHAYDEFRHTWRYDVGGYAWDNSELSPDLWLWLYFLQTGRADVYRMAEALTRHTGEVDVYHIGPHKGLGTRHGVQHWSDSCKQVRISNALYRKYFYYLSGGDERVGDLLQEVLDTEKTFLTLDPYRKVRKDKKTYKPDPYSISISLGTDWAAMVSAWIIEVERKGPRSEEAEKKILATVKGIGNLANGFVTGTASYNIGSGEISAPPEDPDNKGVVKISHLSAMFGLFEVCAELIDTYPVAVTADFERVWLDYCRYFNSTAEEQIYRYGVSFGKLQLRQGHSRLSAYAARMLGDKELAKRAWKQFFIEDSYGPEDGYGPKTSWKSKQVSRNEALVPVEEAAWVSTNISALYGIAAIQNLALIGEENDE